MLWTAALNLNLLCKFSSIESKWGSCCFNVVG